MPTKETYQIAGNSLSEVINRLNFVLARIADRLDKIEGLRGELETEGATLGGDLLIEQSSIQIKDEDDAVVHSLE
jgi:hypothetical protein